MTRLLTKGRKDENQAEIVLALRKMGCKVFILDAPLDLLVGHRGKLHLLEVKDGSKFPSHRRLTTNEAIFFDEWRGYPLHVVESVEQALALFGVAT
jgi:hypothetical protein